MRFAIIHHCDTGLCSGPDAMTAHYEHREDAEADYRHMSKRREVAAAFFYEIDDEPMEFWRLNKFMFLRA